jgi:hypothetical protein
MQRWKHAEVVKNIIEGYADSDETLTCLSFNSSTREPSLEKEWG